MEVSWGPVLMTARPSMIEGEGYSQAGAFWGVLNVSLRACGAKLGPP